MASAQQSQIASDFVTSKSNQSRVMSWSETQRPRERRSANRWVPDPTTVALNQTPQAYISVAWISVNINMTHLFARDQPSGISGRDTRGGSFRQTVRDGRQTGNHATSCQWHSVFLISMQVSHSTTVVRHDRSGTTMQDVLLTQRYTFLKHNAGSWSTRECGTALIPRYGRRAPAKSPP